MNEDVRYVDFRGLLDIWPTSKATVHRTMKREVDPFPPGKMIGGKRFWAVRVALAWLERQDDAPRQVGAADVTPEPKGGQPSDDRALEPQAAA